jgi:molybdopterin synthase sulfur carrier subunit
VQIRILLFASLREAASTSELPLALPDDTPAGAVLARLSELFPRYGGLLERCAIAVNAEYAGPDQRLHDGDVVAVIPPVSGGCREA